MERQLKTLEVGKTTVVNGVSVTRWSESLYEIGTWGTDQLVELWDALEMILA